MVKGSHNNRLDILLRHTAQGSAAYSPEIGNAGRNVSKAGFFLSLINSLRVLTDSLLAILTGNIWLASLPKTQKLGLKCGMHGVSGTASLCEFVRVSSSYCAGAKLKYPLICALPGEDRVEVARWDSNLRGFGKEELKT
jgi:hypothetical protein